MKSPIRIGAMAKATDTKIATIRYYERIGLLRSPGRTSSNYRVYGADEVARLQFIRRLRHLGFSIGAVRDLVRLADEKRRDCSSVAPIAQAHLDEVERKIANLMSLRRELGELKDKCDGDVTAGCRIFADGPARAAQP